MIIESKNIQIARGKVGGESAIYKFGRSKDVDTVESYIWDGGNGYYWLPSAQLLDIVSDSVLDVNAGANAWKVKIQGLDASWQEQEEEITLNGTTIITSSKTFRRVFRAWVSEGGSVESGNAGNISIYESGTPANKVAQISAGEAQTLMAIYTVPACCEALLTAAITNVGQGKAAVVKLKTRDNNIPNQVFRNKASRDVYENSFSIEYVVPRRISEKTDIVMTATSVTGTISCSASFELTLFNLGD